MGIAHSNEYRRFILKNTWFGYRIWCTTKQAHRHAGGQAPGYADKLLNYIKR